MLTLKGKIVSGVYRGWEMIKKYKPRLVNLLGFEPFEGTLDIQLEEPIKISDYATKRIEHVLLDGSMHIDAHLAPVKLTITSNGKKESHECWVIRQIHKIHHDDLIEVISKDKLREKFNLKEGGEIEVTFFDKIVHKKKPVTALLQKLTKREATLKKR